MKKVVSIAVVAALVAGSGWYWMADAADRPLLIKACAAEIARRLPAGTAIDFGRVVEVPSEPATMDQVMGWSAPGDQKEYDLTMALQHPDYAKALRGKLRSFGSNPWLHRIIVEYHVPDRKASECAVTSEARTLDPRAPVVFLMVDGLGEAEWTLAQTRTATGIRYEISAEDEARAISLLTAP